MIQCVEWAVANALTVAILAPAVYLVGRAARQPALRHGLWILLLIKLLTPPLVGVELDSLWNAANSWRSQSVVAETQQLVRDPVAMSPVAPAELTSQTPVVTAQIPTIAVTPIAALSEPLLVVATDVAPIAESVVPAVPAKSVTPGFWSTFPTASVVRITAAVWLIGSFVVLGVLIVRIGWFARQVAKFGRESKELAEETALVVLRLGRSKIPRTRMVRGVVSPMLFGVGPWTTLLFPEELFHKLSREARGTLILHEIAHFCRGDHWVRPLECAASVLYWWHPAVWWSASEIESSEEECCDHWVMQRLDASRRCYAEALMDTIDFLCERQAVLPPAASGLGNPRELRERLTRIMRGNARTVIGWTGRVAIVAVVFGLPLQPNTFAGVVSAFREGLDFGSANPTVASASEADLVNGSAAASLITQDAARSESRTLVGLRKQGDVQGQPNVQVREWGHAVSADGRFSVVRLSGKRIELRDATSNRVVPLDDWSLSAVDFLPDGRHFVTSGLDRQVRLWDAETGRVVRTFAERTDAVASISVDPSGQFFTVGTRGGELARFDVEQDEPVATRQFDGPVNCIRYSSTGDRLALGLGDWREGGVGSVVVLDMASDEQVWSVATGKAVGSVGWADQPDVIAASDWTGGTVYHNIVTGERLAEVRIRKDLVSAASFAHHGEQFPPLSVSAAIALEHETAAQLAREMASALQSGNVPSPGAVTSSGVSAEQSRTNTTAPAEAR